MAKTSKERRAIITGLGAMAAAAGTVGVSSAQAQAPPESFAPTLHREDAWMSEMGGKHRAIIDVTLFTSMPDAVRFAGNILAGHKAGWGVEESDVALLVCLRHQATAYGYTDAIWSKHGKVIDPRATTAPTTNAFHTGERPQLGDLARRGVQFMICGTASRGLAGRIAGPNGDADAVMKEMAANLIPNARIVPAGVVGVLHAQERGFALISVV